MPKFVFRFLLTTTSLFVLTFSLTFAGTVFSQDAPVEKTDFEKAYDEYQAKTKEYETAHQDYVLKRSQYLRFKTLTSQEDAYDATMSMLLARNDVLVYYFKALKEKMKEGEDIPDDMSARLFLAIDDQTTWLTAHQNTTSTAGTLDDLVADSTVASKQYNSKQMGLGYESLATFSLGKILGYTRRTEDLFAVLKRKIDEIRNETREGYTFSAEKFQVLDRWMFDAETRVARAKQKNLEVQLAFNDKNFKSKSEVALNQHDALLNKLGQSQLFLKEANTFMSEVIRELKTAEK